MTTPDSPTSSRSDSRQKSTFFRALAKSRNAVFGKLTQLISRTSSFDQAEIDELHDTLILSDIGYDMSATIIDHVTASLRKSKMSGRQVIEVLREELVSTLQTNQSSFNLERHPVPAVVLMVGVNGVGKTTTCAKLAAYLQHRNHTVMLAACDTYRAAAIEQLQSWGQHLNIRVVAQSSGADPAAVAHDAMHAATASQCSVLLIDTAGRQQTRKDLLMQLSKIHRVIGRIDPSAPHEILITIDAGTGQNAIAQVREFSRHVPVSGICIAKLDGTAKGGIAVALSHEFALPITFIGLGEGIDDLSPFEAEDYVASLLGTQWV